MKIWMLILCLVFALSFQYGLGRNAIAYHSETIISGVSSDIPPCPGIEMDTYLEDEIKYPEFAMENGIEGEVILLVDILSSGIVDTVQIVKGIGFGCDEEALRLVQNMPNWNPAIRNGVPVKSRCMMKLRFRLW